MIEGFAYFGMIIAIFAAIAAVTWFIGWAADDDNYVVRWILVCAIYTLTVTLLIMALPK